ncbi:hypothetical protein JTE90_001178, partial [Oedothorax gibbosus]
GKPPAFAVRIILKIKIKRVFSPFPSSRFLSSLSRLGIAYHLTMYAPPNNPPKICPRSTRAYKRQGAFWARSVTLRVAFPFPNMSPNGVFFPRCFFPSPFPFGGVSLDLMGTVGGISLTHSCASLINDGAFGYLKDHITPPFLPELDEFLHFDIQSTGKITLRQHRSGATQCYFLIRKSDSLFLPFARGCSPLGTAGYGYGPQKKLTISLDFQRGPKEAHRTPQEAVLLRNASLSPDDRFQGHNSYKKVTLPRVPLDVFPSSFVTDLSRRTFSVSRGGNFLNPPSLLGGSRQKEQCFSFRGTSRFGTGFSDPLGPTDPCSTAVHMEPFSSFILKAFHLSFCYYKPRSAPVALLQAGSRKPGTFNARHRDPPTPLRRKPPRGKPAVAARYRPTLERHPFSWLFASDR